MKKGSPIEAPFGLNPPSPKAAPGFQGYVEFAPGFTPRSGITHIIFDFDGTLSLVRGGWTDVMLQMCLEHLPGRPDGDPQRDREMLLDDILTLNGKPTIYQMLRFAERVRERGGQARDAEWYKEEYLARLGEVIAERKEELRLGEPARRHEVRGAWSFLNLLRAEGYCLILASGTDERFVREEARLLGLDGFFGNHIYAAPTGREKDFSKRAVMAQIIEQERLSGERLLGFGDGHVETENIKEFGGVAVAVASDEKTPGSGRVDPWKRARLLSAGADVVIPDYEDGPALMRRIMGRA